MPDQLHLSRNELSALLNRTLEGIYFQTHDYQDMAEQILWLEMHGLNGVEILIDALPSLESGHVQSFDELVRQQNDIAVDAQGHSLIRFADILIDLVTSRAKADMHCSVVIENCYHPEATVAGMVRLAQQGLYSVAYWGQGSENNRGYARIEAGKDTPDLEISNTTVGAGPVNIHLSCAISKDGLSDELMNQPHIYNLPSGALAANYHENLCNGVKTDLSKYRFLASIADRVLVEASEQSRSGAGE